MNNYKKLNTILGWIVFMIASAVYLITVEPTASFWDCGEYIATAYKLQVGHPPGAPLFQLLGRVFSLFAFGNEALVARMINSMSALSSSFTILFLFWSITMLVRKLALRNGEVTEGKMYAILGSGVVGALAYTFTDSFWFSAVEGEVYAMSSFFTALVFWAILKWEESAEEEHSFRWIIFIAYMVGLSVGVHLLNLLAIPAIAFVYYFKKSKKIELKGMFFTLIISVFVLGLIMTGIIPWVVKLAGSFELLFVNVFGLPFNSGTIVYFLLLIGGIVWGIRYTRMHRKVILNTIIWGLTFILIGYSSFFLLIIRSNANTPIDENNPEDAISLLAYLNREQYGDWPIMHGQYFNAPVESRKDGKPVYRKDKEKGKYFILDKREGTIPVYNSDFTTIFPRMWSSSEQRYINDYKKWAKIKGIPVSAIDESGEKVTIYKPTFGENLRFFFRYQISHMYFRYFMWNFAGRQNDIQGMSDQKDGNWISGITFLDEARLGPVHKTPKSLQSKANNKFYLFPLLLGLIGLVYQFRKDRNNGIVVSLLFLFTGLAITVYLNQYSPQPRERDYAYAASFYAFAIWIGLGVFALFDIVKKKLDPKISAFLVSGILLLLVPGILASEGWDDHDRSGRYTGLAIANNYLNSCAPNAILFTNGDNDTFPLWYAQEVEGLRTDVRVVNLSLLNTEWYIEQMKRKAYDSDPVPFSLPWDQYKDGTRAFSYFFENENIKGYVDLNQLLDVLKTDPERLIMNNPRYGKLEYFPTRSFKFDVDKSKVLQNGTVAPELADLIVDEIKWKIRGGGIGKNHLMVLDLLASNNWERPVHFAITTGNSAYIGLEEYFQLEGFTYKLVPIRTPENQTDGQTGRINTSVMFDNVMNKYEFGNMNNPKVYLDETSMRMTMNLRNNFFRLTNALIDENKPDSARMVMDRCLEVMPDESVPYNYFVMPIAEAYYEIGEIEKGNELSNRLVEIFAEQLEYYFEFSGKQAQMFDGEKQQNLGMLQGVMQTANQYGQDDIAQKASDLFEIYYQMYLGG
jgi:hypothetical protein